MKFVSAATTQADTGKAVQELVADLERQLGGSSEVPDLVLFFATPPHAQFAGVIVSIFQEAWKDTALLGATASNVLHPVVSRPARAAITVMAAQLPGVAVVPFRMKLDDFERTPICLDKWQGLLETGPDPRMLILAADPFTTPTAEILESLELVAPGLPTVGALASGAKRPGGHILALNDSLHRSGLVGISLAGNLRADVIVSQGYKPVGRFFRATRVEGNVVLELSGVPALQALEQMVSGLTREEQVLLRRGLMMGEAVGSDDEEPGRGDFLIRPVVGLDHEEGAISVAGLVGEGRRIRFQVWDDTLIEDLKLMLLPQIADNPAAGGLLFGSWPGRRPGPEMRLSIAEIQTTLGYPLPITGFRGSGEIGPIRGVNYLHTHTAVLALIRPASKVA